MVGEMSRGGIRRGMEDVARRRNEQSPTECRRSARHQQATLGKHNPVRPHAQSAQAKGALLVVGLGGLQKIVEPQCRVGSRQPRQNRPLPDRCLEEAGGGEWKKHSPPLIRVRVSLIACMPSLLC